ncbi:hypothetical protein QEJ61_gp18 [Curtobacterium phage Pize]|nr:hypothetical protein QEJ61_gp18 [Curtobacterium phage Pize]QXG07750.1 hypothetical protein [Curtobacterium phage Pize]
MVWTDMFTCRTCRIARALGYIAFDEHVIRMHLVMSYE